MRLIIPAREGSKGLPGKNRLLFSHTAKIIPSSLRDSTFVTTDDTVIKSLAQEQGFKVHNRPKKLCDDVTSMKEVMLDFFNSHGSLGEITVLLYLTYPQRKWSDVHDALEELNTSKAKSLLCAFDVETHPYLIAFEEPNNKGRQICPHNLFRRQDYPKCFEISHFVSAFYDDELPLLNDNLYNCNTHFMKREKKVDIDLPEHLEMFKNAKD